MSQDTLGLRPGEPTGSPGLPALSVDRVARHFGDTVAIREVSLDIAPGEIHALLGPNGAGKTTLLRIVSGMTAPSSGEVWFRSGDEHISGGWEARHLVGVVPSGERSFYLRLSGLENLTFFACLAGLRRRDAVQRSRHLIDLVGLGDAATRRVGLYSQGMRKRLSAARALLVDPPVLLVDEATHDLDPVGAKTVRDLVAEAAERGAAVLWATQRLEELRGFAHRVTVMQVGEVRFQGSVDALIAAGGGGRHIVRLGPAPALDELRRIAGGTAAIDAVDADHVLLTLAPAAVLGDALGRFAAAGVPVLDCRRERPEIEEAFFALTQQVGS